MLPKFGSAARMVDLRQTVNLIHLKKRSMFESYHSHNIMPLGVIGNTSDFGSEIGESYSPEATKIKCVCGVMVASIVLETIA